jgi:hypothetical protein
MVYDAGREVVLLFGGTSADNSTWEWNGSQWTERTSRVPLRRAGHSLAYDEARNEILLHGGVSWRGDPPTVFFLCDTWVYRVAETWVNFAYPGLPNFPETGTRNAPFNTLSEAVNVALPGSIVKVNAGSSSERLTVSKSLRLEAIGGLVIIGQ